MCFPHALRAPRIHDPMPYRGYAADNGCANKGHHEWTLAGVKYADNPLVARKQIRNTTNGLGIDRKEGPRHVDHAYQAAVTRHVHPMVVLGAQVNRCKISTLKSLGERCIPPYQRRGGVIVPLSLEYLVSGDNAELADDAI